MKLKAPTFMAAVTLTVVAAAQHGAYGPYTARSALLRRIFNATSSKQHRDMTAFSNAWLRKPTAPDYRSLHYRKSSAYERSIGSAVQPGRVMTREERTQRRREYFIGGTMDGQADEEMNCDTEHNLAALRGKIASSRFWSGIWNYTRTDPHGHFEPLVANSDFWTPKRHHNLRSLICFVIVFLMAFGAFYVLLEYLLLASRASACSVTTVYIPVTYTVTAGPSLVSAQATANKTSPMITHTSTTTQTSTVLETLTSIVPVPSASSEVSDPQSTSGSGYAFTTNSAGSTEWINGNSPTSGASIVVVTTTVTMQPLPPHDPRISAQFTAETTDTITIPAQTSTAYSVQDNDITSTSISTHYITYTLDEVSPSPTRTITTTRSSFDGTSSWNDSASTDPSTDDPVSRTIMTSIAYSIAGPDTTSTMTRFLTTTIAVHFTTTVYPSTGMPFVTTITALPVTISEGGTMPATTNPSPSSISIASASIKSLPSNSSSLAAAASPGATSLTPPGYGSGSSPLLQSPTTSLAASSMVTSLPSNVTLSTLPGNPASLSRSSTSINSSAVTAGAITATATSSSSAPTKGLSSFGSISVTISGPGRTVALPSSINQTTHITSTGSGVYTSSLSQVETHSTRYSTGIALASTSQPNMNLTMSTVPPAYSTLAHSSPASSSSFSLTIINTFASKTTHMKGTPLQSTRSSHSSSNATSKTMRAKGSPLSGTNSSRTTRAEGSPFTGTSQTGSRRSGMTTSVRSSVTPASSRMTTQSSSRAVTIRLSSSASSLVSGGSTTVTTSTTSSFSNPFSPTSATATPTAGCGEHGDFLLTFDDLPNFLPTGANTTSISQAPPIFSPYHHLTFSDGYVYAPEPSEPYQPISAPHVAVFLPNATSKLSSTQSRNVTQAGEIGDGPYESESAFWFNALSAYFGCDNAGPGLCTLVFRAYTWDPTAKAEALSYRHDATIPPCTTMQDLNCQLQQVNFPASFQNLTGLQIQAFTLQGPRMFYMDNLSMSWGNNSCAAGLLRQSSQ